MKKHTDFILTLAGIALLAGMIALVYQSNQPDPIVLDFTDLPALSDEHKHIGEALKDPEAFSVSEDMELLSRQSPAPLLSSESPLPTLGAPLPVAWESQPAPTIDEVELSPALERSLAASASLRTEDYTNPSSELNLQRIEDLREIRLQRHAE